MMDVYSDPTGPDIDVVLSQVQIAWRGGCAVTFDETIRAGWLILLTVTEGPGPWQRHLIEVPATEYHLVMENPTALLSEVESGEITPILSFNDDEVTRVVITRRPL